MMKSNRLLLLLPILAPFLSGCSLFNDDKVSSVTQVEFNNLSPDYIIKKGNVNLYFQNEEKTFPYVDVKEITKKLSGFFDSSNLGFYKDDIKNTLRISRSIYYVKINWENNTVETSNFDAFYYFVKSSSITNYSSYLKNGQYQSSGASKVVFNLSDYGFDILNYKNKCLMPLVIYNMLFCSQNYYNLFYNGNKLLGYYGEIDYREQNYQKIFTTSTFENQTQFLREKTLNSLCFAMDYFYGLKEDKNITNFSNYISINDKEKLLSLSANENESAMKHIIQFSLDDLHSRIDSKNYYSSLYAEAPYNLDDCGDFTKSLYSTRSELSADRSAKIPQTDELPVRYQNDTAIITLDSFTTGTNSNIFDSSNHVKDDAWIYDSYWLMDFAMKDIQNHGGINNIILDLSLNGGGNIGAMYRVFGFLTNKDAIDYSYNTLTNEFSKLCYKIDTNRDGNYNDNDSFDSYNWSILTSISTFSAANGLVCKAKQVGAAKIIGQSSGGGMCSILPLVLSDGTAITISSQNTTRFVVREGNNDVYYSIENGFEPDITIPYSDFYIDSNLVSYLQ